VDRVAQRKIRDVQQVADEPDEQYPPELFPEGVAELPELVEL
jgi:hypothetical protein